MVPLVAVSCSENERVGPGGACLQATDCEDGLVCVPVANGRVCSNDLSGIQPVPEKDASVSDATLGDASQDAPVDAPRDTNPPPDVNVPDTRPPTDSGNDAESGT